MFDAAAVQEILAIESERLQALLDKDIATLARITAEEYVHVDTGGGQRDKADFLRTIGNPSVRFASWVIEENHVQVYGDCAVVSGRYHASPHTPAGVQPAKYARHLRVYVKRDGTWLNVAHQATQFESPVQNQP